MRKKQIAYKKMLEKHPVIKKKRGAKVMYREVNRARRKSFEKSKKIPGLSLKI